MKKEYAMEEVTLDLIEHMRKTGRGYDAEKLLNAYFENKEKNKKQVKREIKNKMNKVYSLIDRKYAPEEYLVEKRRKIKEKTKERYWIKKLQKESEHKDGCI